MCESAALVTTHRSGASNLFSAGAALPGTDLVIMDKYGSIVPPGVHGEI